MKKTTVFFNMRTADGVETVDEFTRGEDNPTDPREFRKYVNTVVGEYRLAGMNVYKSSRCTKDWKNKP